MPDGEAQSDNEDKAWATFNTPLTQHSLLEFCQDIESLLRINPYLVFKKWQKTGTDCYVLHAVNHSQDPAFEIVTSLQVQHNLNEVEIHYDRGLKTCTTLLVETIPEGSRLTITERYKAVPEHDQHSRLHEVDRSLTKWAQELQAYLMQWQRWSWFTPWRFYMRHVWQPMQPSSRRITYILIWISVAEIALLALGTLLYFIEYT